MPDHDLQIRHIQSLKLAYQRLLSAHGYDAVVISSGAGPRRFGDDQGYYHHGYGHFLHWTGLTGVENSWLRIDGDGVARLWLHRPEDFWHAVAPLPNEGWTREIEVIGQSTAEPRAEALLGRVVLIGDPRALSSVAGDDGAAINPAEFLAALDRLRVCKSAYEVDCLERATALAAQGHEVRVHISYGTAWFPWYMRRLAERPANLWFVMRKMMSR